MAEERTEDVSPLPPDAGKEPSPPPEASQPSPNQPDHHQIEQDVSPASLSPTPVSPPPVSPPPATSQPEAAPTQQPVAAASRQQPEGPQEKKAKYFVEQAEKKVRSSQSFFGGLFGYVYHSIRWNLVIC